MATAFVHSASFAQPRLAQRSQAESPMVMRSPQDSLGQ